MPSQSATPPPSKSLSEKLKPPKKSVTWDSKSPSPKRPSTPSLPPLIQIFDSKRQKSKPEKNNDPLTPPTTPKSPSFPSPKRERFHLPHHNTNPSSIDAAATPPTTPTTPSAKREHFPLIRSIARGEKPIIHKIQETVEKRRVHKTTLAKERMPLDEEDSAVNIEGVWEGIQEDAKMMPRYELGEETMSDSGMDLRSEGMERGRNIGRRSIGSSVMNTGDREFAGGRKFPLTGKGGYGPLALDTKGHSGGSTMRNGLAPLNRRRSKSIGAVPRIHNYEDHSPLFTMSPTQFSPRSPTSTTQNAGSLSWPPLGKISPRERSQTLPQNKPNKLSSQQLAEIILRDSRTPTPIPSPLSLQPANSNSEESETAPSQDLENKITPPKEEDSKNITIDLEKPDPFESVQPSRTSSIYSRKRNRPVLSPRTSSFLKPKTNAEDQPFCIHGKTLEQTNNLTDFLASLDEFIQWEKRECTGLLGSGSGSSFLFNLAFASSVVDPDPSSLSKPSEEGFPFRGIAKDGFKRLYNATKTFIKVSIEGEGREFDIDEVASLQKEVLGCLDEVCDPGMVDQMPRNELLLLVPSILDVFAREVERRREEEVEALKELVSSMAPVERKREVARFKTVVKPEFLLIGVVIFLPIVWECFLKS